MDLSTTKHQTLKRIGPVLATTRGRATATNKAAMRGRLRQDIRIDISQAEVSRPALRRKVFRLHQNDEVAPGPAPAPTPQHVVRKRRPRQQVVQAVNPPQAAPPTLIVQPVRFEQPVAEVGYPALQPQSQSPRAALPRERQPFGVRQYAIEAVAPPPTPAPLLDPLVRYETNSFGKSKYPSHTPDDALWCHGGCGQSIHVEFFEL